MKIRNLMKRISVGLLAAATAFTSINVGGIGMQTAYAQYASGTYTGCRETWTGGATGSPGHNVWTVRYTTESTSGNYDCAYPNGGTISDVQYSGYIFRKKGVSLTARIDFSNVSYIQFDMTRRSSDAGDGIMFSAISDSLYNTYIYPTSSGSNASTSASTMQSKMKAEVGTVYKTSTKGVTETKTYDCASLTGAHYLTIMNYGDSDGASPMMQISAIRLYGPCTSYSDCHVTASKISGAATVDYGTTAIFTAIPSAGSYNPSHVKYQWYDNGRGSANKMAGKTSNTLSITGDASTSGHTYYCQVYADNDTAGSTTSGGWSSIDFKVNPPSITTNPQNAAVDEESTAAFSATAKNATAYQWQVSTDEGVSWKNISGATSTVLNVTGTTLEMNGNKYRCVATSGIGQAVSSAATLTVREVKPEIIKQPSDLSIIEGRTITFVTNAKFYRQVQWQKSRDGGRTWEDIAGETGPTYVKYEAELSQDNEKYRAVVKNKTLQTITDEVTLKVNSKKFIGFYVEYPSSEVNYKSTIKASDVFAIFRYDNGDSSFCKNADGLTFANGKTELYMDKLGEMTINCYYTGISTPKTFTVNVIDKEAPEVKEVDISWKDEEFSGSNLSNDANKVLRVNVTATDNSDGKLKYSWFKGDDPIDAKSVSDEGRQLNIDGSMGNAVYKVIVSDEAGNAATRFVTVNAWDFENPKIAGYEVTPASAWAAYRSISIEATDNNALDAKAYSYDGGKTWLKNSTLLADRNTTYHVIVRDLAGNTDSVDIEVTNIDRDSPEITAANRIEEDGKVYVKVEAVDDTSNIVYGYKLADGEIQWQESGTFEIEDDESRDAEGRTFYAKDEAGNVASLKVYINSEYIDMAGVAASLNATKYQNPEGWVSKEEGVMLGFSLISANNIYNGYTWSNEAGTSTDQSTTVHENGNYSVSLYITDGNGGIGDQAAKLSYDVANIDSTAPNIEISEKDGMLEVSADDNQSGVDRVYVKGGNYPEETLILSSGGNEADVAYAEAIVNGEYTVRAIDSVGNEATKTFPVNSRKVVNGGDIIKYIIVKPIIGFGGQPGTDDGEWKNGYTKGNIKIIINLPDDIKNMLADKPYSWDDGQTWSDSPEFIATSNGVYHLWIRLADGTIIKCPDINIDSIDREAPDLAVISYGMKIYITAKDAKCGLESIKLTGPDGLVSDVEGITRADGTFEAEVEVTTDGTYKVSAIDFLGNEVSRETTLKTRLLRIVAPDDITGIKNGTELSEEAMGLPGKIKIVTNNKAVNEALVKWDLNNLVYGTSYDKNSPDKQLFVIAGEVLVPDGVAVDEVDLRTQIAVTVDESRETATSIGGNGGNNSVSPENGADDGSGMKSDKYSGTFNIKLTKNEYTFTGSQIRPRVKLKYYYTTQSGKKKSMTLKENKHYTLSYENNVNVGTASVVIKGIGDFTGELTKEFTISKKSLKKVRIKGLTTITFGTDPAKLKPTVKDGKKVLVEGIDYELVTDSVAELSLLGIKYKKLNITIKALEEGNYKDSKNVKIKMIKRSINNPLAVKVIVMKNKSKTLPDIEVTYNGMKLREGSDYNIVYKTDKKNQRIALITGHGNYTGTKKVVIK